MDPLVKLAEAAREMSREVARRRMVEAFASPDAEARRQVGERFSAAVARHRDAVSAETWASFEGALAEAIATGQCDALTVAVDAVEAERLARKHADEPEPAKA